MYLEQITFLLEVPLLRQAYLETVILRPENLTIRIQDIDILTSHIDVLKDETDPPIHTSQDPNRHTHSKTP